MEQANSVADYLKILERYKVYSRQYYRGQLEKYVTIPPSIARNRGYSSNESAIYHESIGMKKDEFKDLLTPLEKLAKLQHYGIPTRLVDVTIDPLIALFFAVENVDDLSPGNVYVYLVEGYPSNSKEAKLLSILPTLPNLKVDSIIAEYKKIFGGTLSYDEVLKIVCTPIIIQYSDELQISNPRLYSQRGTFLICGNEVVDDRITDSLKSLDAITPSVIIRIPFEFKKAIKDELDLKYSINQTRIYPELPSVADYIKEKYKEENLSLDGKYSIVKTEDVSHALAKRISITIVLTEPLRIDQIKSLVVSIIDQHKKDANVVWVYVARNGDDYILSNWILRGQWIDPHLNKKYRPLTLKSFENGYYWDYGKSYSTMSDYYDQYVFEDDKMLFVYHQKIWEKFWSIYQTLQNLFQENRWDDLTSEVLKQKSEITRLYMQLQDSGHSHNKEFDDFLNMFTECISPIDDLHFWIEKETLSAQAERYQIGNALNKAERIVERIMHGISKWSDKLQITDQDYHNIDPIHRKKPKFNYTPTLPISKDALEVQIEAIPVIHVDKTVHIEGTTNLFDGASLILSMRKDKQLLCQAKTVIENRRFVFPQFSNKGNGFVHGIYSCEITLSIPSVQPKEFTKLAGIEYENLTGNFIKRDGVGPHGIFIADTPLHQPNGAAHLRKSNPAEFVNVPRHK